MVQFIIIAGIKYEFVNSKYYIQCLIREAHSWQYLRHMCHIFEIYKNEFEISFVINFIWNFIQFVCELVTDCRMNSRVTETIWNIQILKEKTISATPNNVSQSN